MCQARSVDTKRNRLWLTTRQNNRYYSNWEKTHQESGRGGCHCNVILRHVYREIVYKKERIPPKLTNNSPSLFNPHPLLLLDSSSSLSRYPFPIYTPNLLSKMQLHNILLAAIAATSVHATVRLHIIYHFSKPPHSKVSNTDLSNPVHHCR